MCFIVFSLPCFLSFAKTKFEAFIEEDNKMLELLIDCSD